MSKLDLIKYKAIDRGWTRKDLQRVDKKLKELLDDMDGSISFSEIDDLAMMLDEPIDYKLEYSLCRLAYEGKFFISKLRDDNYLMERRTF